MMLATQDANSLQARIFGTRWLYLDPPRHLFQFNPKNLSDLSQQIGFQYVKTSWASLEMGPYCILQSMLNCIVGNNNDLFRYLKNRNLPKGMVDASGPRKWPTIASILLLPILGPLAVLLYFVGLAFKQGDVFEIYMRKPD
jgi:hypothetical protein